MSSLATASAPRYAWYGRVSTEDEQDPTLSFPRQLGNAERLVADSGGRIVAHFYDVESGTRAYSARGSGGLDGFDISIPRDGGLQDLLAEATRRPPRFDRVIVESISRLSRNSSVAFRIEDELRTAGVRLCASDEPLEESFGTIVLRHVNIGIARGYHHELMVKSRQGLETSTRQGWHTGGVALYGYRFVTHDHPNPHKAARGQAKRTLDLDPVRAPVVRAIYDMYLSGGVGITQIRDRLNADPDSYPPPIPVDPARSLGAWSRSSVWEVLRNPKYTGHQVWNRRARKKGSNRINPPDTWIWSEQPAHPAIVSREEYLAVQTRATANRRSRQGSAPSGAAAVDGGRKHTDYLYRGLLHCGICGLRMWGNHRRAYNYYSCQPSHQRSANIPVEHPKTVYLNEDRVNAALFTYLGTAVFGPDRLDYWTRCLDAATGPERAAPAAERIRAAQAEVADLERRLDRQLINLEADDTTPALRRRVAARISELEAAITERQARIDGLTEQAAAEAPTLADIAPLLSALPILAGGLQAAPQRELRALFDQLNLEVSYQPSEQALDVALTLYDDRTDQSPQPDLRRTNPVPPAGFAQHGNRRDQRLCVIPWSSRVASICHRDLAWLHSVSQQQDERDAASANKSGRVIMRVAGRICNRSCRTLPADSEHMFPTADCGLPVPAGAIASDGSLRRLLTMVAILCLEHGHGD